MSVSIWNFIIAIIVLIVVIGFAVYGLYWVGTHIGHTGSSGPTSGTGFTGCTGTGYTGTIILNTNQEHILQDIELPIYTQKKRKRYKRQNRRKQYDVIDH